MRVVMIGATGLVGSLAAVAMSDAGHSLDLLLRRPSGIARPDWREHVAPPSQWPELAAALGADVAISALGTTIRQAGSKAAFRAVDLDLVIAFARAAAAAGARRMVTISSVGADPASRNFYLRTKGEMEAALDGLGFDRLDVIRPGLCSARAAASAGLANGSPSL